MINIRDIGAIGNGQVDDTVAIQTAIDNAVNANDTVFIPRGKYRITKSLNAMRPLFKNFTLKIIGEGTFWDTEISSIIYDAKEGHALNIQNGKGCVIEGVNFVGKYKVPLLDVYTTAWEDYNDTGVVDTRVNPYCAIAVDAINNNTRSGSTGTIIRNCSFRDFTGAINYSPNGFTLNNEMNLVEYCRGRNLKYFLSGGQAQEKMNVVRHIGLWDNIHTCFVWAKYGQGQPGSYFIENINIAGKVGNLVFRPSQSFYPLYCTNVFAESLGSIGYWNTSLSDAITNSVIHLQYPDKAGFQPAIYGQGVTLRNTMIRYYGMNFPVMLKGKVKLFDNSFMVNPVIGHRYAASDPLFEKGFRIRDAKLTDLTIENKTTVIAGDYKVNDIIVFYQTGNLDFLCMGQVTQVIKGFATVSHVNLKTGRYRYGIYEAIGNTVPVLD